MDGTSESCCDCRRNLTQILRQNRRRRCLSCKHPRQELRVRLAVRVLKLKPEILPVHPRAGTSLPAGSVPHCSTMRPKFSVLRGSEILRPHPFCRRLWDRGWGGYEARRVAFHWRVRSKSPNLLFHRQKSNGKRGSLTRSNIVSSSNKGTQSSSAI